MMIKAVPKAALLLLMFLLQFSESSAQNGVTISGLITDLNTGDPLAGVNILLYRDSISANSPPYRGSASNRLGFYAIPDLSEGEYFLIFRSLGYDTHVEKANITIEEGTLSLSLKLKPKNIELSEVVISEESDKNKWSSTISVSPKLLKMLPTVSGGFDIFRSLQLLPGIQAASEMSSGLYVRGGSPDQTLTLVDGTMLYNPAHLGNIASTFNSGAIHDIRLIKGAFPAEYGGRLSSVLDIKLRGGVKDREKGELGLGSILSHGTIEGPLSANTTYMISARMMYFDFFQERINKESIIPRYNFIDLNSKINHNFDDNTILTFSVNYNKDNVYNPPENNEFDYNILWKNTAASINWLKATSKSLFLNINASYINYSFTSALDNAETDTLSKDYFSSSDLKDFYFKSNLEYIWHSDHKFKSGIELVFHSYNLQNRDYYDPVLEISPDYEEELFSTEGSFFVQNEWTILPSLSSNVGLRISYFNNSKNIEFEPRISLSYAAADNFVLKTAYARANQFLHLILRNDIALPTDLWYPSTAEILPSSSEQYIFGFDTYFDSRSYLFSAESYYKTMKNIYEFKDITEYSENIPIEDNFSKGEGEAYGIELFLNKRSGSFTGWIGYTLSWTRRLFYELNASRIFYPRYDRRHDVSVVLGYQLNEQFSFGLTWTYASGQGFTMPTGQYTFSIPNTTGPGEQKLQYNYTNRNNHKLPDYHKLDLSSTYYFTFQDYPAEIYLSLQNVYNRKNAFAQYISSDPDKNEGPKLKQITLMPFLPTAGISIKF